MLKVYRNNLANKYFLRTFATIDFVENEDYTECFSILGLQKDADQEQVRLAFINLCKRFHPDSGSIEADTTKFHQIETAYRKLQNKFANERYNISKHLGEYGLYYKEKKSDPESVKEFDIKHTAPQHRHYLSFDGYGFGTPSQRQRQYQQLKAQQAVDNVREHRISKVKLSDESALLRRDQMESQKIKTRSEIDRLVEDLIQESMARGDFDNLRGSGKPLPQHNVNPYVDFVTHKLNEVLIENGFTPEWILLQKEIETEKKEICSQLENARSELAPNPLGMEEEFLWNETIENLRVKEKGLNKKINHFNLVVPLLAKQMLLFNLNSQAKKILENGQSNNNNSNKSKIKKTHIKSNEIKTIFDIFESFFGK